MKNPVNLEELTKQYEGRHFRDSNSAIESYMVTFLRIFLPAALSIAFDLRRIANCMDGGEQAEEPANDVPVVHEIEVWAEGFLVTGDSGRAQHLGTYVASSLREAFFMWVDKDKEGRGKYVKEHEDGTLTHWGCKIFDNEKDARRSFG